MGYEIIPLADERRWTDALAPFEGGDVYYRREYLRALVRRGEGDPVLIRATGPSYQACHAALIRRIEDENGTKDAPRVDLVSPYGYSGPLLDPPDPKSAQAFLASWTQAALDLGAVSEFVRFHPLLQTHVPFAGQFETEVMSQTVLMNLKSADSESGLSNTCRKNIRTAVKKGVRVQFHSGDEGAASRFGLIYRLTMERRGASPYYMFEDKYFHDLVRDLREDLWIVLATHDDQDVAGAAILRHGPYLHYHLAGSRFESRSLCATNLILKRVADRGREMGLSVFHLGGGLTADDTLFHFKAGFSPLRGEFHAGRRIYDAEIYEKLAAVRKSRGPMDDKYFPAYRAPIAKNGARA